MARPPLPLGQHGEISIAPEDGVWVARCRVRGLDGVTRKVEKHIKSRTAARLALQDELLTRTRERSEVLRPESRFSDAAALHIGKVDARREDSTAGIYRYWLDKLLLPHLGALRLAECDVAQIDAFFARLERGRWVVEHKDGTTSESRSTPRTSAGATGRSSPALQQAVLHKAIAANPVRDLERIESPKAHRVARPRGLTPEERRRLLDHVDSDKTAVRADMPDLIRFAIGCASVKSAPCAGWTSTLTASRRQQG